MMNQTQNGIIQKAIGGFYYVEAASLIYECKARGVFRKNGLTPLVGDRVVFTVPENGYASIEEILPRKNQLIRPPVANLDQLIIVVSVQKPIPNLLVIDKLIALAEHHDIEPVIVISKSDLEDGEELAQIYRKSGFQVLVTSAEEGLGIEACKALLAGKISAFTGNSGVGKSSLLNQIDSRLGLPTAQISEKLGRGRHTTRHVELFTLDNGAVVADTPGFSSVDCVTQEWIDKESLPGCFREFRPFLGGCKFVSCSHTKEVSCAIVQAVERGEIPLSRFESYKSMYEEVKDIKEWERK